MQDLNEQAEEGDKYQGKRCWCAEKLITSGRGVIQNDKTLNQRMPHHSHKRCTSYWGT